MATTTAFSRSRRPVPPQHADQYPTFVRWMFLWIAVGVLVVLVVIGFLIGIVSALRSINDGLYRANAAVVGIHGDADPLPFYVQEINGNLTRINRDLKPIPNQANQIIGALSSIHGRLGTVQGSLVTTSGSLVNTSGSLVSTSGTLGTISSSLQGTAGTLTGISSSLSDTSGKLVTISSSLTSVAGKLVHVSGTARAINATLNNAETVPTDGTQAIWRRVREANGGSFAGGFGTGLGGPSPNPAGLQPVLNDATRILTSLGRIVNHLVSICNATVLNTVPGNALLVRSGPKCS